jgi:hypothetical protein
MKIDYLKEPQFLVSLGESTGEDDFTVITDREKAQNIVKNISDILRHPVTIIDINRPQMNRIDSDISYLSMRYTCKLFRRYAGEEKCHECDRFHAAILKGVTQTTTKDELDMKIQNTKNPPSFFTPFYRDTEGKPKVIQFTLEEHGTNRLVIEYHCPILGYRELLFPIFYDYYVIGVLFVVQTIVRDMDDYNHIKKIQESFFSKPENYPEIIFKETINKLEEGFDAEELKERIFEADDITEKMEKHLRESPKKEGTTLPDMTFDTYAEYKEFISKASNELNKIEIDLKKRMIAKRIKYFDKIIDHAVKRYLENTVRKDVLNETTYILQLEDLKKVWDCFYKAKEKIKIELELDDIVLFGDGVEMNVIKTIKKKVYSQNPEKLSSNLEWEYDFSKLDKKYFANTPLISLYDDNILIGLCDNVDKANVILLVYPDVVILLKVKDLEKHREVYTEMAECIGKGFAHICSDIALRAANFMKERYMFTLRMYRHESSHISTRLSDNIIAYFNPDASRFLRQEPAKQDHIINDMKSAILLISNMALNIGILTGSINENIIKRKGNRVDVINLLYKWQIMFKSVLHGRNLDIKVQEEDDKIEAPRYIRTNLKFFELLLYNLVDNAVKYAHRGSVIRLGWYCSEGNYELTVSSYGPEIKIGDNIYKPYVRGENNEEGDGMGLYVVKRICGLLKLGGVSHISKHISNYNVPLIQYYFDEFQGTNNEIKMDTFRKDISSYHLRRVINDNGNTKISEWALTPEYLLACINKETWLTEFTVKVPVNMGL